MADRGKLTDKGFTIKHKKLKGETLAEVDKDRKKNGCVDPNDKSQKFYAVTAVTVELKIGTEVWYPGGMHILSHQIITNPQLSMPEAIVSAEIEVCVPDKLGSLSSAAKKEWKRFYQELLKHEKKHVADGVKVAQQMLNDLTALSVTMKTETVNEAAMKKEALKLLGKEAQRVFGGGEIEKRINAAMKKLDSQTGHGSVKLKTSIE